MFDGYVTEAQEWLICGIVFVVSLALSLYLQRRNGHSEKKDDSEKS